MSNESFITSLIIRTNPPAFVSVCQALVAINGLEVHGQQPEIGKLVVLLERPTMREIQDILTDINNISGVLNASMVYQHAEPNTSLNEVIA